MNINSQDISRDLWGRVRKEVWNWPLWLKMVMTVSVAAASGYGSGRLVVCCLTTKLCPTLGIPWTIYSPPGSSVHGISQARILECVAIPFSRGSSQPRERTRISCIAGGFFTTEPPGNLGWLAGSLPVSLGGWGQFRSRTFYRVFLSSCLSSSVFFSNLESDLTCQRGSENHQKE